MSKRIEAKINCSDHSDLQHFSLVSDRANLEYVRPQHKDKMRRLEKSIDEK